MKSFTIVCSQGFKLANNKQKNEVNNVGSQYTPIPNNIDLPGSKLQNKVSVLLSPCNQKQFCESFKAKS